MFCLQIPKSCVLTLLLTAALLGLPHVAAAQEAPAQQRAKKFINSHVRAKGILAVVQTGASLDAIDIKGPIPSNQPGNFQYNMTLHWDRNGKCYSTIAFTFDSFGTLRDLRSLGTPSIFQDFGLCDLAVGLLKDELQRQLNDPNVNMPQQLRQQLQNAVQTTDARVILLTVMMLEQANSR